MKLFRFAIVSVCCLALGTGLAISQDEDSITVDSPAEISTESELEVEDSAVEETAVETPVATETVAEVSEPIEAAVEPAVEAPLEPVVEAPVVSEGEVIYEGSGCNSCGGEITTGDYNVVPTYEGQAWDSGCGTPAVSDCGSGCGGNYGGPTSYVPTPAVVSDGFGCGNIVQAAPVAASMVFQTASCAIGASVDCCCESQRRVRVRRTRGRRRNCCQPCCP